MTVYGGLADSHCRCNSGEGHTGGKSELHDAPGLWRDIIADQRVYARNCLLVGPLFRVVLFIVKEIETGNAPVDIGIADMVETPVADCSQKISDIDG